MEISRKIWKIYVPQRKNNPYYRSGAPDRTLFGPVNNASVFEPIGWEDTSLEQWNPAMMVNLTAPFLLSQAFARSAEPGGNGRTINLIDWRGLRPGPDHLPYTISNSALAALTHSLAIALAPRIIVNRLALGAILSPSNGAPTKVNLDIPLPSGGSPPSRQADAAGECLFQADDYRGFAN